MTRNIPDKSTEIDFKETYNRALKLYYKFSSRLEKASHDIVDVSKAYDLINDLISCDIPRSIRRIGKEAFSGGRKEDIASLEESIRLFGTRFEDFEGSKELSAALIRIKELVLFIAKDRPHRDLNYELDRALDLYLDLTHYFETKGQTERISALIGDDFANWINFEAPGAFQNKQIISQDKILPLLEILKNKTDDFDFKGGEDLVDSIFRITSFINDNANRPNPTTRLSSISTSNCEPEI